MSGSSDDPDVYFMADFELADLRRNGFMPVGLDGLYKCLYGCGTAVWDMEAHRNTQCPDPIVGKRD